MGKCLIIGQGLAGSFLALSCFRRGIDFHVIDQGHPNSASRKAAGLWNPVSFKRITAHEAINDYLQSLHELFEFAKPHIGSSFYHPLPLFRIFPDQAYANDWDVKSETPKMHPLLGDPIATLPGWQCPYGAGLVNESGWIDVPLFLDEVRNWLIKKNAFSPVTFLEKDLDLSVEKVNYNGVYYSHIIFCTGLFQMPQPFDFLKIIPNKGHLLELGVPGLNQSTMVHYGHFCIPIGNGKVRIGSTYEWEVTDTHVQETLSQELANSFHHHCTEKSVILHTYIGHRPTVVDRNPIIGLLPQEKRFGIFNGLGTKGILQGPHLSKLLVDHLVNESPIPKPFHVNRFLNNSRLTTSP